MNPAQKNKIDVSVSKQKGIKKKDKKKVTRVPCFFFLQIFHTQQFSEEEKKVFRMYGKLPDRKDLLDHKLKVRKAKLRYFLFQQQWKGLKAICVCVYFLFYFL